MCLCTCAWVKDQTSWTCNSIVHSINTIEEFITGSLGCKVSIETWTVESWSWLLCSKWKNFYKQNINNRFWCNSIHWWKKINLFEGKNARSNQCLFCRGHFIHNCVNKQNAKWNMWFYSATNAERMAKFNQIKLMAVHCVWRELNSFKFPTQWERKNSVQSCFVCVEMF